MVEIDLPESERQHILTEYYACLEKWINARRSRNIMFVYFKKHLKEIICCNPSELKDKTDDFEKKYKKQIDNYNRSNAKSKTSYGRFCANMSTYYKTFMNEMTWEVDHKNGYVLMRKIKVTVCPYCNRAFTTLVDEDGISIRAEFDHFYPKSKYPILALSFYNLVPACPTCNHFKDEEELSYNPWSSYIGNKPQFKVDTTKDIFPINPKIIIDHEDLNTQKLGIKLLYNTHSDYVTDILNRIQAYNPDTYSTIVQDFQGICSESDLSRIIWGNYIDESDIGKRPLAKLTKDILEQYKIYVP